MFVIKDRVKERKYYKYSYDSWTRPNITSNNTMGFSNFACTASLNPTTAYQCFDGNISTYFNTGSNSSNPQNITFYSKNALNITQMTIYQFTGEQYYYSRNITIQGSENGEDWIDITTWERTSWVASFTIDMSSNTNYYNYYRVVVTNRSYYDGNNAYWILGEIECVGTQRIKNISTKEDYDIYEDVEKEVIKTPNTIERKYYKYKTLSNEYKELNYIYAPAGTLINTNFIPNSNTKIDCEMKWTTSAINNYAFGAGVGYQDRNIELYSSGATFEIHYSAYTTIGSYTTDKYFRFVQDKGLVTVYNENGSQNSTYNFGTKTFDCVYNMHIFGLNRGSNNPSSYPNYLKYFKIWDNETLIRDYVPAERISDNIIGLYDKQNGIFYTNIGSGNFEKGNYIILDGTSSDYDFYEDINHTRVYKSF